jgi:hypothetical protein
MVKKVPSYNKVDESLVKKLKAIVGEEYVMADNPPMMQDHLIVWFALSMRKKFPKF